MSTTQLADHTRFTETLHAEPQLKVSQNRSVISIRDDNGQSYSSGVVTIDASKSLASTTGLCSLKDSYLVIPYKVSMKNTSASGDFSEAANSKCLTLKTGVWNLVNSLKVELNKKQIISRMDYTNFWNNFRAQTEFSYDTVYKHASDTWCFPDDWESISFSSSANSNGDGYSNNKTVLDTALSRDVNQSFKQRNNGFVERLKNNPLTDSNTFGFGTLSTNATKDVLRSAGWGGFKQGVATNDSIMGTWYYLIKIRLGDLHPVFNELPLMANPELRLELDINAGEFSVNTAASGNTLTLNNSTVRHRTCPVMLSSAAANEPMNAIIQSPATGKITVGYGPLVNTLEPTINSDYWAKAHCSLETTFYELEPDKLKQLINKPLHNVRFLDLYTQYITGQAGTGVIDVPHNKNFDISINSTHSNIKYVVVAPFANTSAGTYASAHNTEQYASPFDSAPFTLLPCASITNFNVVVGNKTVFGDGHHEYNHQQFMNELSKIAAVNGDLERSMSNGLLSYIKWAVSNHWYVADCSRVSSADVGQSVQIRGNNRTSQGMNLLVMIIYERSMDVDVISGRITNLK